MHPRNVYRADQAPLFLTRKADQPRQLNFNYYRPTVSNSQLRKLERLMQIMQ